PSLGTLAHVLMASGDYDAGAARLHQAQPLARPGGPTSGGILDSLMQLATAKNDSERVESLAVETLALSSTLEGGYSYYGLWHLLTRVKWLLRTNRKDEAVDLALDAIPRIERMADRNLLERMQLLGAEALGQAGRPL